MNNITIEKREWQTYYDPKEVGQYLRWYYEQNKYVGEPIKFTPRRSIQLPPPPSLEGFLMWSTRE